MQVVAVTDPLELGFARQAMIGIRVRGPLRAGRRRARRARRGRLRRGHRRLLRPARRGGLRERRAPARADLRPDPGHRRRRAHRDVHVPQACASRPTRGACAERRTPGSRSGTPTRGDTWSPRPALPGDLDADVAIVGAGFTGLWTAYYLAEADPTLRIVVLEAEVAGFGASGPQRRLVLGAVPGLARTRSPACPARPARRALAQHRAMRATVDEVGRVADRRGHRRRFAKGGTIVLARTGPQWRRARAEVARRPRPGAAARRPAAARRGRGRRACCGRPGSAARRTPRTARRSIPRRLVRGLADAVERRGVRDPRAHPRHRDRAGPRGHRARAPCAPRSWCGRPRATRPASPASAARWCRSTR